VVFSSVHLWSGPRASAFRHRIQGVDDEIHQHLLDLAFVGFDAPESVAEIEEQIDFSLMSDEA